MSRAPEATTLLLGFAQTRPVFGAVAENLKRVERLLRDAPTFDVLVLPELFSTGYLFRDRAESEGFAEALDGPTVRCLSRLARERNAWIAGGFAERDAARVFNAAALAGPHGELHLYRKVHLFDRERDLFDAGDHPFLAIDIDTAAGRVRVGIMICFDWFFPESMRSLALDRAEVVLHPSNLVMPWCQEAMRTRCLENRVFAVTANRVGEDFRAAQSGSTRSNAEELRLAFTGKSQIVDVRGSVLASAGAEAEEVRVASVSLPEARTKTLGANDLFRDRRPDLYRA